MDRNFPAGNLNNQGTGVWQPNAGYNTAPYNAPPFAGSGPIQYPTNSPYPPNSGSAMVQWAQQQQTQMSGPSLPSPNPMPQMMGIHGRTVNDVSDIRPNEVPMDGSVCLFPKSDYSCIYAKVWDKDGNLQTYKFIQEAPDPVKTNQNGSVTDAIMERLENIEGKVDSLVNRRQNYNPKYNHKPERMTDNEQNAASPSKHGDET